MIKIIEKEFLKDDFILRTFTSNINIKDKIKFSKNDVYYFGNYDKNKLKEVNKYAFLDINKEYYKDMEEKIKKEFMNIEMDIKNNQKKCKEIIEKVLSKVEYYDVTKKLTNLKIINGDWIWKLNV